MFEFSKSPIHLLDDETIKTNGKLFVRNTFGDETMYVQDPKVYKNIFTKDFNIFPNRRVSLADKQLNFIIKLHLFCRKSKQMMLHLIKW